MKLMIEGFLMTETEQKIIDAALKLFSNRGYQSATTMAIAEQAGVSEKTLFRKFKTKRNLYDQVVIHHHEILTQDFDRRFKDYTFETPRDFLKALVMDLKDFCTENYEIIHLVLEETSKPSEPAMGEWIVFLSEHIKENIKNDVLDYPIFTMTILFFIYTLVNEKNHGRVFFDINEALDKFVTNLSLGIS
jgi:AcrR family transcriptional regulator